jgi:hypothetical protein
MKRKTLSVFSLRRCASAELISTTGEIERARAGNGGARTKTSRLHLRGARPTNQPAPRCAYQSRTWATTSSIVNAEESSW